MKCLKKVEREFLTSVCEKIKDPVINDRIVYLLEWYSRKAQFNKFWYNFTRFFTYLFPCVITLISVYVSTFDNEQSKIAIIAVATISSVLVVIHHIVDHCRFYENWIRYRSTAEKLKREAELFLNLCEPYDEDAYENEVNITKLFANKIESIVQSELADWENLREESNKPFQSNNQAALQTSQSENGLRKAIRPKSPIPQLTATEETPTDVK